MITDEIKYLIELIEKLESRINSYWNFYIIVILGVSGWIFSKSLPLTEFQRLVITFSLSAFFIANFSVIRAATRKSIALEKELISHSEETEYKTSELKKELTKESMPGRMPASYILHAIVDAVLIAVIWLS